MSEPIYLLQVETGNLFGYSEQWEKMPGFVVYDPDKHGYREEVAHVLGLEKPKIKRTIKKAEPSVKSASKQETDDPFAGIE